MKIKYLYVKNVSIQEHPLIEQAILHILEKNPDLDYDQFLELTHCTPSQMRRHLKGFRDKNMVVSCQLRLGNGTFDESILFISNTEIHDPVDMIFHKQPSDEQRQPLVENAHTVKEAEKSGEVSCEATVATTTTTTTFRNNNTKIIPIVADRSAVDRSVIKDLNRAFPVGEETVEAWIGIRMSEFQEPFDKAVETVKRHLEYGQRMSPKFFDQYVSTNIRNKNFNYASHTFGTKRIVCEVSQPMAQEAGIKNHQPSVTPTSRSFSEKKKEPVTTESYHAKLSRLLSDSRPLVVRLQEANPEWWRAWGAPLHIVEDAEAKQLTIQGDAFIASELQKPDGFGALWQLFTKSYRQEWHTFSGLFQESAL